MLLPNPESPTAIFTDGCDIHPSRIHCLCSSTAQSFSRESKSWTPNSISVEIFLEDLIKKYGRHPVWTDGADWYSLACESMNLKHHVYEHGTWLWEVTERAVQRLKDRTESFDDLFPCRNHGTKCKFVHIYNWINMFWLHHQPMYQSFIKAIKNVLI